MAHKLKNYSGAFNATLELEDLEHSLLACYGREVMLANHIHDRSALLPIALQYGMKAQTQVACDEWMGASPIYNYRNRQLMKMENNDVETVLKCLQLDIGAPHNFLAFHYELRSPEEGFFWTTTCGPYNHVRRMTNNDPDMEKQICHHMEDPTFDATVMAVNPRMRCRPVYRPPYGQIPKSGPCRWRVAIEKDVGLVEDNPTLAIVQQSKAAEFQFAPIRFDADGMTNYQGPLKRDLTLEDLSHNTLARQCKEFALDVHLLNRACYSSIAERWGASVIAPMAIEQWRSIAPLTVHRLRKTFNITDDDMSAILKILQLNPFLPKEYLAMRFELISASQGRVWLEDCAALHEPLERGLVSLLTHQPATPGFDAMVTAVNPLARVSQIDTNTTTPSIVAWDIHIDSANTPATGSELAGLVAGSDLMHLDNREHHYHYTAE
ncbi:MAG: hypothetical protein HRT77_08630 [Halioglobus sp.]|nr:hypothetical protein [Halioglobus sp.]